MCLWSAFVSGELSGFEPVAEQDADEAIRDMFFAVADAVRYRGVAFVVRLRRIWKNASDAVIKSFIRLKVHYFIEVSESAKCPACGIRKKHNIEWSEDYEKVMHSCARCKARWAESPVAGIDLWRVKTVMEAPKQETIGKK